MYAPADGPGWVDIGAEKLPAAKRSPVANEVGGFFGALLGGGSEVLSGVLGSLGDPMYVVSATKAEAGGK